MIPQICEEDTKETVFVISNPLIIKATQEFFDAPSTKYVTKLPSTANEHFNFFTYGLIASNSEIKFRNNDIAEDFAMNFSYDYNSLKYTRDGLLFKFEPETVLEITYEVEDLLDAIIQDTNKGSGNI